MSLTLELPADLAAALEAEAGRLGLSLGDYALQLLASAGPRPAEVRTGADLVAYWQREGLIGTRPDIADSPAHARALRQTASETVPAP
jgi:hypothetical protein